MRAAAIALLVVAAGAAGSRVWAADDETPAAAAPSGPAPGASAAPAAAAPAEAAPPAPAPAGPSAEPPPQTQPGQPGPPPGLARPPKSFPKLRQVSLLHTNQLGIAAMPGTGFRGIFPYQENIPCGNQGKRVCTGRLPLFLDVQPSFGFAQHWDVLLDLRFGIGTDFTMSHQFAIAPGFRYWVDPELGFKFFATLQGVFDSTAQHDSMVKDNDFGIRNANGVMFEVMRNLGFFIQFGETLGFVRWLRFEIDAGAGMQVRLP